MSKEERARKRLDIMFAFNNGDFQEGVEKAIVFIMEQLEEIQEQIDDINKPNTYVSNH